MTNEKGDFYSQLFLNVLSKAEIKKKSGNKGKKVTKRNSRGETEVTHKLRGKLRVNDKKQRSKTNNHNNNKRKEINGD